jgi:hypothetical protein
MKSARVRLSDLALVVALACSAFACGACPDGTEPDDKCACSDGTTVAADQCTPAGAAPAIEARKATYEWSGDENRGDWLSVASTDPSAAPKLIQPPQMQAGDEATLPFSCGDKQHTQLEFLVAGRGPDAQATMDLLVDGKLRGTMGEFHWALGWRKIKINVEQGPHQYAFVVKAKADSPSPFGLDGFKCYDVAPVPSPKSIDFDDGFVPLEIAGDWFVDSLNPVQDGEASIHPLALRAGDEAAMQLACAGTEMSFQWAGAAPDASAILQVWVDGTLRSTFGESHWANGFAKSIFASVPGDHVYELKAIATTDGAPPYTVDSITCADHELAPAANGHVDFDDGIIPTEMSGDWFVSNAGGVHEGTGAARPPALEAGGQAKMIIDCSQHPHSKLSFRIASAGPDVDGELELSVDGSLVNTYGAFHWANGWLEKTVDVTPGGHTYEFTAKAKTAGVPFAIDTIVCDDI